MQLVHLNYDGNITHCPPTDSIVQAIICKVSNIIQYLDTLLENHYDSVNFFYRRNLTHK